MMERRLTLAKRLLNPEGSVLIATIDENEVHRLSLLLEQLFPSSKIQMVTALINPAGASIIDQFARVDEHLLFVHIGSARPQRTVAETTPLGNRRSTSSVVWESLQRSGGNSRRQDTKAKFFPIYIDEENRRIVGCGGHLPEGKSRRTAPAPPSGCIQQWPIKTDVSEACWQLSSPTFMNYMKEGRIRLGRKKSGGGWGISFLTTGHMKAIADGELTVRGRDASGVLIVDGSEGRARTRVGKTIWINGCYSATEHGSTLLRKFIPQRKFPFPKSLYAVEDALRFYVGNKPNALVVDFFAGSGTTAHAVMRLNKQDDGRRQCILVTNNEVSADEQAGLREQGYRPGDPNWEAQGICEYLTKPRIAAAVTGKATDGSPIQGDYKFIDEFPMADGFAANDEFFTMTYEAPRPVAHNRAFEVIAPLLWLRAGSQGRRIEKPTHDFDVADTYAVLFDLDASQGFLAAVAAAQSVRFAFIVTDDDRGFQMVCSELPARVDAVRLYESYLTNFTINTGRE
jgi:adenine-specific DNA-methyltransferase